MWKLTDYFERNCVYFKSRNPFSWIDKINSYGELWYWFEIFRIQLTPVGWIKNSFGPSLSTLISWTDSEEESKHTKPDLRSEIKISASINDGVYRITLKVKKLARIAVYIKYWKGVVWGVCINETSCLNKVFDSGERLLAAAFI